MESDHERLVDEVLKEVDNLDISANKDEEIDAKPAGDGDGLKEGKKKKVTFENRKQKTPEEKAARKQKLLEDWIAGKRDNAICFLNQMTSALKFQEFIDKNAPSEESDLYKGDSRSIVRFEFDGKTFQGTGSNKKVAKQAAATAVLHYLEDPSHYETSTSDTTKLIYTMNDCNLLESFSDRPNFVAKPPQVETKPPRPRHIKTRFDLGPHFTGTPRILARANGGPAPPPISHTVPKISGTAAEQTAELFKNPTAILNFLVPTSRYTVKLLEQPERQIVHNGEGDSDQAEVSVAAAMESKDVNDSSTGLIKKEPVERKKKKKQKQNKNDATPDDSMEPTKEEKQEGNDANEGEQAKEAEEAKEKRAARKVVRITVPGKCVVELCVNGETFEASADCKKRARSLVASKALEKLFKIHCEEDADGMMKFYGAEQDWKHLKPPTNFRFNQGMPPHKLAGRIPLLPGSTPTKSAQPPPPPPPQAQHPVCVLCEICPGAKFSYEVIKDASIAPTTNQDLSKATKSSETKSSAKAAAKSPTLFSGAAAAAAEASANQVPAATHVVHVEVEGLKFEGRGPTKPEAKKVAAEAALLGIQAVASIADKLREREHKRQLTAARKRGFGNTNVRRSVALSEQDYEYGYRRLMGYNCGKQPGRPNRGRYNMDGSLMNNAYQGGDWGGQNRPIPSYGRGRGGKVAMGYTYANEQISGEAVSHEMGGYSPESYGRRVGGPMGYSPSSDGNNSIRSGVVRRAGRGRNWQNRASGEPYPVGLVGGTSNSSVVAYPPNQLAPDGSSSGRNHLGGGQYSGLGGGYAPDSSLQMAGAGISATGGARMGVGAISGGMMLPHGGEAQHSTYYQQAQQPLPPQQMISGWRGGTFPPYNAY